MGIKGTHKHTHTPTHPHLQGKQPSWTELNENPIENVLVHRLTVFPGPKGSFHLRKFQINWTTHKYCNIKIKAV